MFNPPDPKTYNALVYEIVRQIPPGQVSTYGQIAAMIPPPEGIAPPDYDRLSPRWVGNAMNNTPSGQDIPWQRVINSKGMISLPEGSASANEQRLRLEAEGVVFKNSKVDFKVCGWNGPAEAWLKQRGLFAPPPLRKKEDKPTQTPLF